MLNQLFALQAKYDDSILSNNQLNISYRIHSTTSENFDSNVFQVNKTGTYNFYNTSFKNIILPPRAIFLIHKYPTFIRFKGYSTNNNELIGYWNNGNVSLELVINDNANYYISFILQNDDITRCQTLTAFTGNSERTYGGHGITINSDKINKNLCIIGAASDIGVFEASVGNTENINSAKLFTYGKNETSCDLKENNCKLSGTISILLLNASNSHAVAKLKSYYHSKENNIHGYCLFSNYDYIIMTSSFGDSFFWMVLIGILIISVIILISGVTLCFIFIKCKNSSRESEATPEGNVSNYAYADDYAPQPTSFAPNYEGQENTNVNPPVYNNTYGPNPQNSPYNANNHDGFKSPYEDPVKSPYDEEQTV